MPKFSDQQLAGGRSGVLPFLGNYAPELAPSSPSAFNDEFDVPTLAAKWTQFGSPDTCTPGNYAGFLQVTDDDAAECGVWEAYVPGAAAFSVAIRLSHQFGVDFNYAGIVLVTAADASLAVATIQRSGAGSRIRTGSAGGTTFSVTQNPTDTSYILITRDATSNYLVYFSPNGRLWQLAASFSSVGVVGRIRLALFGGAGGVSSTALVDFVRVFAGQISAIGNTPVWGQ